jgi:PAS domain S-box-containing protein
MPGVSAGALAMAAVCLYVAANHLVLHLRRRTPREDLAFAAMCAGIAWYAASCALEYAAPTATAAIPYLRLECLAAVLGGVAFLWFTSLYVGRRPAPLGLGLAALFVVANALAAWNPHGLAFAGPGTISHLHLPLLGTVAYPWPCFGPLSAASDLSTLALLAWVLGLGMRRPRRPERRSWPFAAGAAAFTLAVANDLAVSSGLYSFVYLTEYAWLALLAPVSWGLSTELVRAAHTEAALREAGARFSGLFAACPLGLHVYSLHPGGELTLTAANAAADTILGISHAGLVGKTLEQAFPPLASTAIPEMYRAICRGGPDQRIPRLPFDDGTVSGTFDVHAFQMEPGTMAALFEDITERTRTQEALARSEETLRSLFRVAPAAIGFTNQRRLGWVNERLCSMLGRSAEQLQGQSSRILYPTQEEYERVGREKYAEMRQTGVGSIETRWVHRDGHCLDVVLTSSVLTPEGLDGDIIFTALDVTDRKRAERVARLDEQRLEALLALNQMEEASVQEIAVFAMEEAVRLTESRVGYIAFANHDESVLTMYAWSAGALAECRIGDPPRDFPVEACGLWAEPLRQRRPVMTNDYAADARWQRGLPAGHVPVTRHLAVPVIDDGHVVVVAGVGNKPEGYDATDVRQLELMMTGMWRIVQRRRSDEDRARLAAALEQAVDEVVITDPAGVIQYVNPAFERVTGYGRSELIGTNVRELRGDGLTPEDYDTIWETIETGQSWSGRLISRRRDGEPLVQDSTVTPMLGPDGTTTAYVSLRRDVTDAQRAEDGLREAQRLEAVGQLAAGVAHEFNNILAAMMMRAERAGQAGTPDEHARLVELVLRQTARGAALCQNLTTFARPSSSRRQVVPVELSIEAARGMAQHQLTSGEVEVTTRYQTDGAQVLADPGQLEQVFVNLIINACHAMPRGGALSICTAVHDNGAGQSLEITVADTGTGIRPEHIGRVLEPFFTTKGRLGESNTPGTGLGLSVTHGIIKAHGGTISVESTVGVGSTFTVRLPVHEKAQAERE